MATFKAEVYAHQKKADGTYNIKIRVTQNQRKRYLANRGLSPRMISYAPIVPNVTSLERLLGAWAWMRW